MSSQAKSGALSLTPLVATPSVFLAPGRKFGVVVVSRAPSSISAGAAKAMRSAFNMSRVFWRKFVAILAVSLSCVQCGRATAAHIISARRRQFQVGRVYAFLVVAKVIKLRDVLAQSAWNWFHQPSVDKAMRSFFSMLVATFGISIVGRAAGPVPTRSALIEISLADFYGAEDARDLFNGQVFNGKIAVRHSLKVPFKFCLEPVAVPLTLQPVRSAL